MKKKLLLLLLIVLLYPLTINAETIKPSGEQHATLSSGSSNNQTGGKPAGEQHATIDNNSNNSSSSNDNDTKTDNTKTDLQSGQINICSTTSGTLIVFKIIGYFIFIVKILVPIALIVFATVDFSKVVISGKEDDLKNSLATVTKRAIAGLVVFFIPTIVNYTTSLIGNAVINDYGEKYFDNCNTCLWNVSKCKAKTIDEINRKKINVPDEADPVKNKK